jgi:hypothetical protein
MKTPVVIISLAYAILGCSDSGIGPQGGVTLKVDKTVYRIGETVRFSIINQSTTTAYFAGCNLRVSFYAEREVDDVWKTVDTVGLQCGPLQEQSSIALASESSVSDTISFFVPGYYRFKLPYGWKASDLGEVLVSNQFFLQGDGRIVPGQGIDGVMLGDSVSVVLQKLGIPSGVGRADGLYRS